MSRGMQWALALLGLALVAFGGWQYTVAPTDAARHGAAGFVVAGLLLLPSVPSLLAAGIKSVGGALADAWKAKQATPPSGGAS